MAPSTRKRMPLQPLAVKDGVLRFVANPIVAALLDQGGVTVGERLDLASTPGRPLNMNDLARRGFPQEAWEQFYTLIGYSLSGFHQLSNVSDATARTVTREARKIDPKAQAVGCRDDGCEIHSGVAREDV